MKSKANNREDKKMTKEGGKRKEMKQLKQRKGITLVALVITIIVLLILAGITISLTIGEDGIIRRAQDAGKNYQEAARNENTQLAEFTDRADEIIDNVTKEKNYTMVEGVPVPKGFTHVEETTKAEGFVIKDTTKNADGTPTATNGNEFVWVPCTLDGRNGSIKYDRYVFLTDQPEDGTDTTTNSTKIKASSSSSNYFTEAMPRDEEESIRTYGGFYIGRYESGVVGYDASVSTSNSAGSEEWTGYSNGKLVIQKEKKVWNYITRNQAKIESEKLYQKSKGDSVNSKLCSSYGWDTALKFIETKHPEYPTNSAVGNYEDKAATLGKPALTGKTEAVNNIYDMGGNVWEWTTEDCSKPSYSCTERGGGYVNSASSHPAAYRGDGNATSAYDVFGFRVTLYL